MAAKSCARRPRERRDPYRVMSLLGTMADIEFHDARLWLWLPAVAGTTVECGERARLS